MSSTILAEEEKETGLFLFGSKASVTSVRIYIVNESKFLKVGYTI